MTFGSLVEKRRVLLGRADLRVQREHCTCLWQQFSASNWQQLQSRLRLQGANPESTTGKTRLTAELKLLALTNEVGRAGSNFLIPNVFCCVAVCHSYREKAVFAGLVLEAGMEWQGSSSFCQRCGFTGCPLEVTSFTTTSGRLHQPFLVGRWCLSKTDCAPLKIWPISIAALCDLESVRAHRAGSTFWLPRPFCILPISLFPFPQRPVGVAGPFPVVSNVILFGLNVCWFDSCF